MNMIAQEAKQRQSVVKLASRNSAVTSNKGKSFKAKTKIPLNTVNTAFKGIFNGWGR